MRRTIVRLVGLAAAASAVGCGDKGGGGGAEPIDPKSPVGAWVMDAQSIVDAMKPMMDAVKKAAETMEDAEERTKTLKELEDQAAAVANVKAELTFKGDGTATFEGDAPGQAHESGTGTWTQQGETVTVVQKMKNGKPAEGTSAEPQSYTFKDGKFFKTQVGMTMTFKRK